MSWLVLAPFAFVVAAQVNDPAGDAPPMLEEIPAPTPKPIEPIEPIEEPKPPVLTPKKPAAPKAPSAPLPSSDVKEDAEEIAFAAGAGGIATGLCSACTCGWVPFFGVPIVGVATAVGAAGGALYGAKDKPGWGTAILIDASIAGAGGLIGAGIGTGVLTIAVLAAPTQGANAQPLMYAAIGGAVLLSAAGAAAGAIGGAYAIESFMPTEAERAPPRRTPRNPSRPDEGKAIAQARY